jgi:hypothetical protein
MKKLAIFWMLLLLCFPLGAAAEVFGTVDALSGGASVTGQDGQSSVLSVGMRIYEGDTISSAHDGEVHIVTEDGGFVALRPDTVFRVDQYKADGGDDDKTFMSLLKGAMRSITGWIGKQNNAAYRLTTPTATVGIRGTDHEVAVIDKGDGDEPGTYDTVNEGSTVLKTAQGEVVATPGRFAFAPRGRAVAPYFLAQRPHYFATRTLRLEGRIVQRREYLRGRLQQMREERIRSIQPLRGQRPGGALQRSGMADGRRELRGSGATGGRALEMRSQLREGRRGAMADGRKEARERRRQVQERGEGGDEGDRRSERRMRRERE